MTIQDKIKNYLGSEINESDNEFFTSRDKQLLNKAKASLNTIKIPRLKNAFKEIVNNVLEDFEYDDSFEAIKKDYKSFGEMFEDIALFVQNAFKLLNGYTTSSGNVFSFSSAEAETEDVDVNFILFLKGSQKITQEDFKEIEKVSKTKLKTRFQKASDFYVDDYYLDKNEISITGDWMISV